MKKSIAYILVSIFLSFILIACEREEGIPTTKLDIYDVTVEPSYSLATITCEVRSSITVEEVRVYVAKSPDFAEAISVVMIEQEEGKYAEIVEGLEQASTYYIRFQVGNKWSSLQGDTCIEFQTIERGKVEPTIITQSPKDVTFMSASLVCAMTHEQCDKILECGFIYGNVPGLSILKDIKKVCKPSGDSFSASMVDLRHSTTYYVRAYVITEVGLAYGNEVCFSTDNIYEPQDLGLSVKWGQVNVGAGSPLSGGSHFAWGEVSGKSGIVQDLYYTWNTYKHWDVTESNMIKYNEEDGLITLEAVDDAATMNIGVNWRIPTREEWQELIDSCVWTMYNGYYKVTSKVNNKSIFLYKGGYSKGMGGLLNGLYYWSSSLCDQDMRRAYALYSNGKVGNDYERYVGMPVRPVWNE